MALNLLVKSHCANIIAHLMMTGGTVLVCSIFIIMFLLLIKIIGVNSKLIAEYAIFQQTDTRAHTHIPTYRSVSSECQRVTDTIIINIDQFIQLLCVQHNFLQTEL